MKKNKFTEFFKGKGYYVLLFVGVIAIAAVAIVGSQLSTTQQDSQNKTVDLNDTEDNIAANDDDTEFAENNPISEGIVNQESNASKDVAANDKNSQQTASGEDQIELEGYAEDTTDTQQAQTSNSTEVADADNQASVETAANPVEALDTDALNKLSFNPDDGLLWPVNGNVLMNYSMDHTILFETLMQYRCNPAIIIEAEVGTEVKAATDGVITEVDLSNEETGVTVTMNIGDGYSVVYGQLDNVSLKVGEAVKEGDVIATISQPTKYYTLEGSNLYFQVLQDNKTVNPMLYLK